MPVGPPVELLVTRAGIEPAARALKVRCSTTELPGRHERNKRRVYHGHFASSDVCPVQATALQLQKRDYANQDPNEDTRQDIETGDEAGCGADARVQAGPAAQVADRVGGPVAAGPRARLAPACAG